MANKHMREQKTLKNNSTAPTVTVDTKKKRAQTAKRERSTDSLEGSNNGWNRKSKRLSGSAASGRGGGGGGDGASLGASGDNERTRDSIHHSGSLEDYIPEEGLLHSFSHPWNPNSVSAPPECGDKQPRESDTFVSSSPITMPMATVVSTTMCGSSHGHTRDAVSMRAAATSPATTTPTGNHNHNHNNSSHNRRDSDSDNISRSSSSAINRPHGNTHRDTNSNSHTTTTTNNHNSDDDEEDENDLTLGEMLGLDDALSTKGGANPVPLIALAASSRASGMMSATVTTPPAAAWHAPHIDTTRGSRKTTTTTPRIRTVPRLTQCQLDFGLPESAQIGTTCPHCGLLYSPQHDEDRRLHYRVCRLKRKQQDTVTGKEGGGETQEQRGLGSRDHHRHKGGTVKQEGRERSGGEEPWLSWGSALADADPFWEGVSWLSDSTAGADVMLRGAESAAVALASASQAAFSSRPLKRPSSSSSPVLGRPSGRAVPSRSSAPLARVRRTTAPARPIVHCLSPHKDNNCSTSPSPSQSLTPLTLYTIRCRDAGELLDVAPDVAAALEEAGVTAPECSSLFSHPEIRASHRDGATDTDHDALMVCVVSEELGALVAVVSGERHTRPQEPRFETVVRPITSGSSTDRKTTTTTMTSGGGQPGAAQIHIRPPQPTLAPSPLSSASCVSSSFSSCPPSYSSSSSSLFSAAVGASPTPQACVLRRVCTLADVCHVWTLPLRVWARADRCLCLRRRAGGGSAIKSRSRRGAGSREEEDPESILRTGTLQRRKLESFFEPRAGASRRVESNPLVSQTTVPAAPTSSLSLSSRLDDDVNLAVLEMARDRAATAALQCWCQQLIYGMRLCARDDVSYEGDLFGGATPADEAENTVEASQCSASSPHSYRRSKRQAARDLLQRWVNAIATPQEISAFTDTATTAKQAAAKKQGQGDNDDEEDSNNAGKVMIYFHRSERVGSHQSLGTWENHSDESESLLGDPTLLELSEEEMEAEEERERGEGGGATLNNSLE